MDSAQAIIVIKKKVTHGGHHGGAWKVAYADFVTAMMSLFIVLWLMNSTPKPVQEAIAGYFKDPLGTATKKGSTGKTSPKDAPQTAKPDDMTALKADLMKAIEKMNLLNNVKKQIEISITEEGLRIELVEDAKGTFFEVGKAKPTPALEGILKMLAGQLKDLPNHILIEGYTDAHPYTSSTGYGNWELSSDRANEARREMQADGIRANQVSQVRGFGDQRLHFPDKPFDASNRRVSLIVQNMAASGGGEAKAEAPQQKAADIKTADAAAGQAASGPAAAVKQPDGLMGRVMGVFSRKK
jgi:chemotaxis protein MotB